jgi:hypothetical protein
MMPAPLCPVPRYNLPPHGGRSRAPSFPPNWRWDEPLEYTPEGFLLPGRKTWLERLWSTIKFW